MSKQPLLWVLVADGSRARVVIPDLVEGHFRTVLPLGTAEYPHEPPPLRDDPDHGHSFAAEVGQRLSREARRGAFDHLVLVGPVGVVHDVREHLSPHAADCVVGTVTQDCSRLSDRDLSPHLARWWLAPTEMA